MAVAGLAAAFRRELARDQQVGEVVLAASQLAAQELAGSWPQLSEIERCYTGPGDGCMCDVSGHIHLAEPQPVPAWLVEAKEIKAAAETTLEAIALAIGPDGGEVALAGEVEPFGQGYQIGSRLEVPR